MQRCRERNKVGRGPEGRVRRPDIPGPEAVVRGAVKRWELRVSVGVSALPATTCLHARPRGSSLHFLPIFRDAIDLFDNRRDPDGSEPHALDVVEFGDQASPGSSAVDRLRCITPRRGREVGPRKSVRDNLVDGLLAPFGGRECRCRVPQHRYDGHRRRDKTGSVEEVHHDGVCLPGPAGYVDESS